MSTEPTLSDANDRQQGKIAVAERVTASREAGVIGQLRKSQDDQSELEAKKFLLEQIASLPISLKTNCDEIIFLDRQTPNKKNDQTHREEAAPRIILHSR